MAPLLKRWIRRFWGASKSAPLFPPSQETLAVFSRHCFFSEISQKKQRLRGFSQRACYQNLLSAVQEEKGTSLTFFFDAAKGPLEEHFLKEEKTHPVIEVKEGTEGGAFCRLLDYVAGLPLSPETIVYFVEDDYLHKPGAFSVLKEAFQLEGIEYATLYDHRDKYFFPEYANLRSKLFVSASSHWRTVPSTTQTFATRFSTLLRDLPLHRRFSEGYPISRDHEKFCALRKKRGEVLVSAVPGLSTHAEPDYASPLTDWEKIFT